MGHPNALPRTIIQDIFETICRQCDRRLKCSVFSPYNSRKTNHAYRLHTVTTARAEWTMDKNTLTNLFAYLFTTKSELLLITGEKTRSLVIRRWTFWSAFIVKHSSGLVPTVEWWLFHDNSLHRKWRPIAGSTEPRKSSTPQELTPRRSIIRSNYSSKHKHARAVLFTLERTAKARRKRLCRDRTL